MYQEFFNKLNQIIYGNKNIQPQITSDFMISSNHFYSFAIVSIVGFLTYKDHKKIKLLIIYLITVSIILEIFHTFIPERSYQWSDLFGNVLGVMVVIFFRKFIKNYVFFKK